MKKTKTYKPSQFAQLIGIHIKTLQRWDRVGIFIAHRTPTNRRYYTEEDYQRYLHMQERKSSDE